MAVVVGVYRATDSICYVIVLMQHENRLFTKGFDTGKTINGPIYSQEEAL